MVLEEYYVSTSGGIPKSLRSLKRASRLRKGFEKALPKQHPLQLWERCKSVVVFAVCPAGEIKDDALLSIKISDSFFKQHRFRLEYGIEQRGPVE